MNVSLGLSFRVNSLSFNKSKDLKDKPKKRGLFGKKIEPVKEEVKPTKKGLFGKKIESTKDNVKPKKKGWFN